MHGMIKAGLIFPLILALGACGDDAASPTAKSEARAGDRLKVVMTPIADMKAVGAEITTQDQAEALARIPGILTTLDVREGDIVAKGQRLGLIVDNRLGFESAASGAQVAAAQAEAARAQGDLARIRILYRENVYAKARLDQAEATARAANAQVAAARAQQGAVASVAGQGVVLAPASGRVLRADVPAGSVVAPGMSLATITAGAPVVRLDLPESLAGQVHLGGRIRLNDSDLPSGSQTGQVTQVYPAITAGRVRVDATVPGLASASIGRRVSALIEVGTRNAIVVPRRFVTTRYGMDYVEIARADGAISSALVQVAPAADADQVEILSGVGVGDTLFAARARK